jgi:hypothetical protein
MGDEGRRSRSDDEVPVGLNLKVSGLLHAVQMIPGRSQ